MAAPSLSNDIAVQRRAREGAKRPTRPSDCNGGLASAPLRLAPRDFHLAWIAKRDPQRATATGLSPIATPALELFSVAVEAPEVMTEQSMLISPASRSTSAACIA